MTVLFRGFRVFIYKAETHTGGINHPLPTSSAFVIVSSGAQLIFIHCYLYNKSIFLFVVDFFKIGFNHRFLCLFTPKRSVRPEQNVQNSRKKVTRNVFFF